MYIYVNICNIGTGTHRGQKRVSDPSELELTVCGETSNVEAVFNHWAIFLEYRNLDPEPFIFKNLKST